jgi:hypothetical protein
MILRMDAPVSERQGLVQIAGQGHGKHDMAGVIVERADDGRPSSPPCSEFPY